MTHTVLHVTQGTVLLDVSLRPSAVWQFEAVMVLLSGFWPPRGLVSGSWPPQLDSDADDACSDSSMPFDSPAASFDRLRSPPSRGGRNKHRSGAGTPTGRAGLPASTFLLGGFSRFVVIPYHVSISYRSL